MRADLQGTDGSALLVATPDEFRPFVSEEDAYRWLLPFAHDPTNISTLRRALAEQLSSVFVGRMRDDEVLRQIARLIARACVAVDLRTLPYFTISAEDPAAGSPEEWETAEDLVETAEEEAEFEDIKPEPIIPPEFPRMAKMEASQVELSAKKMGSLLDLLRFIGEKLLPESMVGQALLGLANSHAGAVETEAGNFAGEMSGLAAGAPGPTEPSVVAASLARGASSSADAVVNAADRTGTLIAGLLTGPTGSTEPSAVAGQMKDQAGLQGRGITEKASDTAALVGRMLDPAPKGGPDPSKVKSAFTETAQAQAEGLQQATDNAKEAVSAINVAPPEGEPPEPSGTSSALVMESAVAGEAVSNAAAEAGKTLDGLAQTPEKTKPVRGWATIKLEAGEGLDLANVVLRLTIDGEEKLFKPDAQGIIELEGVPEDGFDIEAMEDALGLEVVAVVEDKAGAAPPPAGDDAADEEASTEPEPEPAAQPEPAAEPEPEPEDAGGIERPLFPEEEAWLAHTNRIRKARGLSLKTRDDIPPQITIDAEKRRERRARRKKKRS